MEGRRHGRSVLYARGIGAEEGLGRKGLHGMKVQIVRKCDGRMVEAFDERVCARRKTPGAGRGRVPDRPGIS
jgi:hypothetical protein